MESETLRSRLLKLLQKSRQAYRLYTSMGRMPRGVEGAEHTEMQAAEWRSINAELIKGLSEVLAKATPRELVAGILSLRESFQISFRNAEAELNTKQRELIAAAEKGDFVKAAVVGRVLISSKARVQALQAAHHELENLCAQCHAPRPPILLASQQLVEDHPAQQLARVIPLRKR